MLIISHLLQEGKGLWGIWGAEKFYYKEKKKVPQLF